MITKEDVIVTAYAEPASGPGWTNRPLWVIVHGSDGTLRQECLQPDEQTRDMQVLYDVSSALHQELRGTVESWRKTRCKKK